MFKNVRNSVYEKRCTLTINFAVDIIHVSKIYFTYSCSLCTAQAIECNRKF